MRNLIFIRKCMSTFDKSDALGGKEGEDIAIHQFLPLRLFVQRSPLRLLKLGLLGSGACLHTHRF